MLKPTTVEPNAYFLATLDLKLDYPEHTARLLRLDYYGSAVLCV